ncbi:uncharacterized protein LOC129577980 [Sitodiplosis mosellana]|uniref:uncharacterized protein LOC129577980 n=1 Tax=Sitodiplosis mosellana TaxID=263140 RepID=UPI00244518BF|nr:uncharacterized protein LOC129577980 [Sitodiplosis mosellana]
MAESLHASQQPENFSASQQPQPLQQQPQYPQQPQSLQEPQVVMLPAPAAAFPQAIHWDDCTRSIYYVDLFANRSQTSIYRYDYGENQTYGASIVGQASPTFILPMSSECNKSQNHFAVGISHNTEIIEWDGRSPTANIVGTLFGVELNDPGSSWDVGRPSENGIFYGGTFHDSFCSGPANSSFYRYVNLRQAELLFTGLMSTTGVASDVKRNMLYHIDTSSGSWPISLDTDTDGFVYTDKNYRKTIVQLPSGLNGIAFGGPRKDILFAIRGSHIIDPFDGRPINIKEIESSLYKVTGLGSNGPKYRRLIASLE